MTRRDDARQAMLSSAGWAEAASTHVAGDASNRRYARLTLADGATAILMDAPPDRGEDVRPFIRIAEHLTQANLSAPRIFAQDVENGFLLIEDLGDALFARLMESTPQQALPLYETATDLLIALHAKPVLPLQMCDAAWLCEMTEPVFEWYAQDPKQHRAFAELFHSTAETLVPEQPVLVLRDFHAENLLWLPDRAGPAKVGLLDFQDAVLGHPAYDLVSVLQDARRDVAPEIEAKMVHRYITSTGKDPEEFRAAYAALGLQRNLRILGIFARLCLRDGKAHYVDLIPRVWGYVQRNLTHPDLRPLQEFVDVTLSTPTSDFLEQLKSRCRPPQEP